MRWSTTLGKYLSIGTMGVRWLWQDGTGEYANQAFTFPDDLPSLNLPMI